MATTVNDLVTTAVLTTVSTVGLSGMSLLVDATKEVRR